MNSVGLRNVPFLFRNYDRGWWQLLSWHFQIILDTDACDTEIGAVLSQEHEGKERVVAYASRTLSKAERKYCVTRKELLAVVIFMKHFRPYLFGHHFLLRTDHGSLVWLYNMKEPEEQLARWLQKLMLSLTRKR